MMHRQFLLTAALGIVTSCVPADRAPRPIAAARAVPVRDPATLLRALALDVPSGPLPVRPTGRAAFAQPFAAAPPFLAQARTEDDAARATECLTAAVYYEARSEPLDGQRAVAQVVLNRVRDRAFPHSVCGVVYQHPAHAGGCQFSFTCDGAMNARPEPRAWERARAVAEAALSGSVFAPIGAAVFYHTQAVSPWWAPSLSRIGVIGAHVFYRWHDALARSLSFHEGYAGLEPTAGRGLAAPPATAPAEVALEGGVAVHRANAATPMAEPRIVEAAGVRIHLGSAAPTEAADAPSTPTGDAQT